MNVVKSDLTVMCLVFPPRSFAAGVHRSLGVVGNDRSKCRHIPARARFSAACWPCWPHGPCTVPRSWKKHGKQQVVRRPFKRHQDGGISAMKLKLFFFFSDNAGNLELKRT